MAKLNWQRLHQQQRLDRYQHQQRLEKGAERYRHTWLIGRHRGKQLRDLPDSYLAWTQENLPAQNPHRLKAFKEITHRQHKQHKRLAGQQTKTAVLGEV